MEDSASAPAVMGDQPSQQSLFSAAAHPHAATRRQGQRSASPTKLLYPAPWELTSYATAKGIWTFCSHHLCHSYAGGCWQIHRVRQKQLLRAGAFQVSVASWGRFAAELVLPVKGWGKTNTVRGWYQRHPSWQTGSCGWGRLTALLSAVTQTSLVFGVQHLQPTWAGIWALVWSWVEQPAPVQPSSPLTQPQTLCRTVLPSASTHNTVMAWQRHCPAALCHCVCPGHRGPVSSKTSPAVQRDQLQTSLATGDSLVPQISCPPSTHPNHLQTTAPPTPPVAAPHRAVMKRGSLDILFHRTFQQVSGPAEKPNSSAERAPQFCDSKWPCASKVTAMLQSHSFVPPFPSQASKYP